MNTVAVVSTSRVPTGTMVADPSAQFPDAGGVSARISEATWAERSIFVDARKLSLTLLGSDQFANMFQVSGDVAYRLGAAFGGSIYDTAPSLNQPTSGWSVLLGVAVDL